jgi:hypothetical protein
MSSNQDQARLIAERVARRLLREPNAGDRGTPAQPKGTDASPENPRARIVNFVSSSAPTRTQSSIGAVREAVTTTTEAPLDLYSEVTPSAYPQVAQSPWLAPFSRTLGESPLENSNQQSPIDNRQLPTHPSQERFGVDEATVSELVEFFEAEKQCSVDPSGKPCDHCAMCSSRGF